MGLKDRYAAATGASPASPAAAPSSAPGTTPAAAQSAASSSSPAAATAATTTLTPATTSPTSTPGPGVARRDLSAMRQRLAGNGGVNPPEALAALKDELADPCTRETPDGGAEPLPNHPDAAKSGGAASSTSAADVVADAAGPAGSTKRKRRTKAEMEAARALAALAPPSASEPAVKVAPTVEPERYPATNPEFSSDLIAAQAETAGLTILTDEVRAELEDGAIERYLRSLSLQNAINLVRERMFPGMKTLEVEK